MREAPPGRGTRWGRRWLEIVEPGPGGRPRKTRARELVQKGAVTRLDASPGRIAARVRASGAHRCEVTITVTPFEEGAWQQIEGDLAGQLRYYVRLLDSRLPDDIEQLFAAHELTLVPGSEELSAACSCCSEDRRCEHLLAVHRAFARALDTDPFLLLTVRGRDRDGLLAAVRAVRSGPGSHDRATVAATAPQWSWEQFYTAGGDPASVRVHPRPADDPAALLRRLGPPPETPDPGPLEELVTTAASSAWQLASEVGSPGADQELLLTELRAQGSATPDTIADILGWRTERARQVLEQLYEDGEILRTGSGDTARYRDAPW